MNTRHFTSAATLAISLASQSLFAATEIRVYSEDGSSVGKGATYIFNETSGALTISKGFRDNIDIIWQGNDSIFFHFTFEGPDGLQLAPSLYEDAQRFPFQDPGRAGLDISGDGSGCNNLTGSFEIFEVEYDQSGVVSKLALDAIQHCETNPRGLRAEVRINSDVPFDLGPHVKTVNDFAVLPGTQVNAGLRFATTTNGMITNYSWTQTLGQPVILTGNNTDTISFIAPITDAEYEVLIFEVTVVDAAGESAFDTVTIISSETTTPKSRFRLLTTPNGFIGGGESREEDIDPAYLTAVRVASGVRIIYNPPDRFSGWNMRLAPPGGDVINGDDLQVGQYHAAYRVDTRPTNKPGIEFGIFGRGCNGLTGEFKILDIGYADNAAIERLAVNAFVFCLDDASDDPVEVRLRIDSVIPFDSRAPIADAGSDQVAFSGETVVLDAASSQNDIGQIQSYNWRQISGPIVNLIAPDSSSASFASPEVARGQGLAAFELTIINDASLSDTELVVVNILGSEDPKNFIDLEVVPGTGFDFVTFSYGINLRFDENAGSFDVVLHPNQTSIEFTQFSFWRFGFGQDAEFSNGDPIVPPGLYEYASTRVQGLPWISASGEGRGCNQSYGHFVVHEYVQNQNGDPESLAIDFEHSCDFGAPLLGVIRINSTVPVDAPGLFASAGRDTDAVPGQLIELDSGGSYIGPSAGVGYQWVQVSGPSVTINGTDQSIATFSAPGITGIAVFRVTITTAEGLTDTALVTVNLLGSGAPMTAMYLKSEPGEPLGRGIVQYFDSTEIGKRTYRSDKLTVENFLNRNYRLTLSTPNGEMIAAGDYVNAFGFGVVPGFPGIDFEIGLRGCNSAVGWFRIYEINPNVDKTLIDKLAVDFWQSCDFGSPPLYGSLRINSTVPLRTDIPVATAGKKVTGRTGTDVTLSAEQSFSWNSAITGYSWTQISGPVATVTGSDTATPTISLPSVSGSGEQLIFEVTVTNSFGMQSSAQTTVTVLSENDLWNEIKLIWFDPVTNEELDSLYISPDNGYFEYIETSEGLSVRITGRETPFLLRFDTRNFRPPIESRIYHRYDYRDDDFPHLSITTNAISCANDDQGWIHVTDVVMSNDMVSSIAYEAEQICENPFGPNIGVRVSGRLNTAIPINFGEPIVIQGPDRIITEGETAYLDEVLAYIEGELASDVSWQQISGPPLILASLPNARTSFVGPAIDGDDTIALRLSLTSKSLQIYSGDVNFTVPENGITGFPADLITTRTATGTYGATGGAIAIESGHIIVLHARSPEVRASSSEPGSAPYGVLDMEFDTSVGETINVTVHFDESVDTSAVWLRQKDFLGWNSFTAPWSLAADLKSVTLELTDGGAEDLDNLQNGRIITGGGIGQASTELPPPLRPAPPPQPSGGGGSAGYLLLCMMLRIIYGSRLNCRKIAGISSDPL